MGNAAAQGQLGDCYAEGLGVEENYDVALQWYREGAAKGDAVSKTGMGYAYAHGLGGVARDEREAKRLFVAASNDYEPKALYCLGWLYDHGMGSILRNKKEAVLYYRRAAVLGHGRAMAHLADCYYFGTGVEKSAKEAMAWYTKAAKTDALLGEKIGFRYLRGTMGMEKNTYNAIQILKIAAEGGSADAYLELGKRYGAGDGVLKDADTAADYYRRGAELGNEACAAALKQEQLFEY